MLAIDKRLKAIMNEIQANTLADIGSDHGKVVVKAVLEKRAKRAVAVDISKDSLEKARRLSEEYGVVDKIEFLCSDGLKEVKSADCIVIAGMGANEIIKILKQKRFERAKYITIPHQDTSYLRQYLSQNNFCVHKDYVIKDAQKFYHIIVFEDGLSNYSEDELYTGKNKPKSNCFEEYLLYRKKRINKIIKQAGQKLSPHLRDEKKEIEKCLIKLKKL